MPGITLRLADILTHNYEVRSNEVGVSWGQSLPVGKSRVNNAASKNVMTLIWSAYERLNRGEHVLLPVIGYYGAGRAWLAHNERMKAKVKSNGPANRWEAFYDCLNERIRVADLAHWFQTDKSRREVAAAIIDRASKLSVARF